MTDVTTSAEGSLTVGQCATLACLLEVNSPKPGNVHRGADFDDATLNDFAASAVAIGGVLEDAPRTPVGQVVLRCVSATRTVTLSNTNLGTILLLAPLAAVLREEDLRDGVQGVLSDMTSEDATNVYEAIRLARPGGLGESNMMDVHESPPGSLLDAMQAAADRDAIAAEYVGQFARTFEEVVPALVANQKDDLPLPTAIVHTYIQQLAAHGDSLIARKCGEATSQQCAARAELVLRSGRPQDESYHAALADFDFWLRSDGRRRNPGTTADLMAAALFVCLRDRLVSPPYG